MYSLSSAYNTKHDIGVKTSTPSLTIYHLTMGTKRSHTSSNNSIFKRWAENCEQSKQSMNMVLKDLNLDQHTDESFVLEKRDLLVRRIKIHCNYGRQKLGINFASVSLCIKDDDGQGSFLDDATVIIKVEKKSNAKKDGLKVGDILLHSQIAHSTNTSNLSPALLSFQIFTEKFLPIISSSESVDLLVCRLDDDLHKEVSDKKPSDMDARDERNDNIVKDVQEIPYIHGSVEKEYLLSTCQIRYNWSRRFTEKVFDNYFRYISLKIIREDKDGSKLFPPCDEVDKMWREHILDVHRYTWFCHSFTNSGGWDEPGLLYYYNNVSIEKSNRSRKELAAECENALVAEYKEYTRITEDSTYY